MDQTFQEVFTRDLTRLEVLCFELAKAAFENPEVKMGVTKNLGDALSSIRKACQCNDEPIYPVKA